MVFFDTVHGKINVIEFSAKAPIGYTILCIHGSPSDARIFSYVGTKLAEEGYDVASIDLPGHGKSDGPKGDLDFERCLQAIKQIISELKKKSRVIIMAHSMGSTFALWYAHLFGNTIDGLIVLCPYVRIKNIKRSDTEPSTLTFLSLLLHRMFTPTKTADITKVLPKYAEISGYQFAMVMQDKTVNLRYSYRYFVDVMAVRNSRVAELADISTPTLILQGQRDRNVYPQVSEEYFKLLKAPSKRLQILDCDHWFFDAMFFSQNSSRHSEESRMRFISEIVGWIKTLDAKSYTDT